MFSDSQRLGHKGTPPHHDVVERIPRQIGLCNERRRNQRAHHAAHAVKRVQEAQQLARVGEVADPGVPRGVSHAVAEAREDEGEDEDNVRRVRGDDGVGGEVARRADDGHAALAELVVQRVVEQRRGDVPDEGREEDERDDNVREVVVFLELPGVSPVTVARRGAATSV